MVRTSYLSSSPVRFHYLDRAQNGGSTEEAHHGSFRKRITIRIIHSGPLSMTSRWSWIWTPIEKRKPNLEVEIHQHDEEERHITWAASSQLDYANEWIPLKLTLDLVQRRILRWIGTEKKTSSSMVEGDGEICVVMWLPAKQVLMGHHSLE